MAPAVEEDGRLFDGAYKPDMTNCLEETEMGSDFCCDSESSCSDSSRLGVFEGGFGFVDGFSMAEEVMKLPENVAAAVATAETEDLELSGFERMKVERQISASLYAMNGVQEYMEAVYENSDAIWDLPPLCSLFC